MSCMVGLANSPPRLSIRLGYTSKSASKHLMFDSVLMFRKWVRLHTFSFATSIILVEPVDHILTLTHSE